MILSHENVQQKASGLQKKYWLLTDMRRKLLPGGARSEDLPLWVLGMTSPQTHPVQPRVLQQHSLVSSEPNTKKFNQWKTNNLSIRGIFMNLRIRSRNVPHLYHCFQKKEIKNREPSRKRKRLGFWPKKKKKLWILSNMKSRWINKILSNLK